MRTPADLEYEAKLHEGVCTLKDKTTAGGGLASDYEWKEIKHFPLDQIMFADEAAIHWNQWQPVYLEDLGHDRFNEMVEYLKTDPDDPIVIVNWKDKFYLWDGFHRTVASFKMGRTTIHAIVGTLKQN